MPTPQSGFFNDAQIETTRPIDFGMTHAPLVFIMCSWAWNDNISHLNIKDWKMKFVVLSFRMFFKRMTGWWFQRFSIFTPIWGRFPIWLIFFKGVETTNLMILQLTYCFRCGLRSGFQKIRFFFGGGSPDPKKFPCYPKVVTKKHPGFRVWAANKKTRLPGRHSDHGCVFFLSNLLPTEAFERHLWCIFQRGSLALGFCAGLMAWLFLANGAMDPIPDAPCR